MNVKQGDLAIQINALLPENIGAIVRVEEFWGNDPDDGPTWKVITESPFRAFNLFTGQIEACPAGDWGTVPDAWLRPVSGLPVEEYDRIMEQEPA